MLVESGPRDDRAHFGAEVVVIDSEAGPVRGVNTRAANAVDDPVTLNLDTVPTDIDYIVELAL